MFSRELNEGDLMRGYPDPSVECFTEDEWKFAPELFEKYGFAWSKAKPAMEVALDNLLDNHSDNDGDDDEEELLHFGVLDFGEVDFFDVLKDLANITMRDDVVSFKEIELLHAIAKACNTSEVMVTAAMLQVAKEHNPRLELE